MSTKGQKNFLFDFLIEPRFKIGRHMLFIFMFSFIVIGQSLFVFGNQMEVLDRKVYWFGGGNMIMILAFAYFNIYFLVPRLLLKNKYVEYSIVLLIGTLLYLIIKSGIESYILGYLSMGRNFNGVTLLDMLSNLMLYVICIVSSSITILFRQWTTDTEKIEDLKNNQLRNNVEELKNQINPKSLSNVLDYVSEEIKSDPKKASDILFKLSDVLRYELYDCKREKVLLASDIEFMNKYLSLEQLSNLNGFAYTMDVTGKVNIFVAPFIFVPVVQKIIIQQPTEIHIKFDVDEHLIKFGCTVLEADLTKCDFSKEEQRFGILYHGNIKISKKNESVNFQLRI